MVNISISKGKGLPVPIALKVGIVDRNESERTECFIIVLDILLISGQENISLARNVSIMYIFNSHRKIYTYNIATSTQLECIAENSYYLFLSPIP